MGDFRYASPCCHPGDGSDRSIHADDERKATPHRALCRLFLGVLSGAFLRPTEKPQPPEIRGFSVRRSAFTASAPTPVLFRLSLHGGRLPSAICQARLG